MEAIKISPSLIKDAYDWVDDSRERLRQTLSRRATVPLGLIVLCAFCNNSYCVEFKDGRFQASKGDETAIYISETVSQCIVGKKTLQKTNS